MLSSDVNTLLPRHAMPGTGNNATMISKPYRAHNFQALFRALDLKQKEFADRTGMKASHVSQILAGVRAPGEGICRRIEQSFALPFGWMDVYQSGTAEELRQKLKSGTLTAEHTPIKLRNVLRPVEPLTDERAKDILDSFRLDEAALIASLAEAGVPIDIIDLNGRVLGLMGVIKCDVVLHTEPVKTCIEVINLRPDTFDRRALDRLMAKALQLHIAPQKPRLVVVLNFDGDNFALGRQYPEQPDVLVENKFVAKYVFDFDELTQALI